MLSMKRNKDPEAGRKEVTNLKKAYMGIDIGSISTKGVIIDEEKNILASVYLWTEGNPMGAAKKVIASLGEQAEPGGISG